MTQKKEAPAKASTPQRQSKDTKFNQYIIDILIAIYAFAIGYLLGIVGGLAI